MYDHIDNKYYTDKIEHVRESEGDLFRALPPLGTFNRAPSVQNNQKNF